MDAHTSCGRIGVDSMYKLLRGLNNTGLGVEPNDLARIANHPPLIKKLAEEIIELRSMAVPFRPNRLDISATHYLTEEEDQKVLDIIPVPNSKKMVVRMSDGEVYLLYEDEKNPSSWITESFFGKDKKGHFFATSVAVTPTGSYCLVGSSAGYVKIFNIDPTKHPSLSDLTSFVLEAHKGEAVLALAVSSDDLFFISVSKDKEYDCMVKAWRNTVWDETDKGSSSMAYAEDFSGLPTDLVILPNNKDVLVATDVGLFFIEDLREGLSGRSRRPSWKILSVPVKSLTVFPNGSGVLAVCHEEVHAFSIRGKHKVEIKMEGHPITGRVAFTSDGQSIVSVDPDAMRVWNLDGELNGKKPLCVIKNQTFEGKGPHFCTAAISPDDSMVFIGKSDASIIVLKDRPREARKKKKAKKIG